MEAIEVKQKSKHITSIEAKIQMKSEKITLNVTEHTESEKSLNDPAGMLRVQMVISSKDNDEFYLAVTSVTTFYFDKDPDDFDSVMKDVCYPICLKEISQDIDSILETMGYAPLHLQI